jgi:hypothetical protein
MALALNMKPLRATGDDLSWHKRVNWSWWLRRVPMLLLAIPSAYGVGAFADEKLPLLAAIVAGGAFECAYIGAIALADQQFEDDQWTTGLWWLVNGFAVIASVLSNLLFFSGGTYAGITPEIATHAIPLPVLGFFYGLLLHRITTAGARVARKQEELDAAKVLCQYCGQECKNKAAEYSHYRTCAKHPKNRQASP